MDNYTAGRERGKLLKEAMPDGGSDLLFMGRSACNAVVTDPSVVQAILVCLGLDPEPTVRAEARAPPQELFAT